MTNRVRYIKEHQPSDTWHISKDADGLTTVCGKAIPGTPLVWRENDGPIGGRTVCKECLWCTDGYERPGYGFNWALMSQRTGVSVEELKKQATQSKVPMTEAKPISAKNVLLYVSWGCSCESYYGYVCRLCQARREPGFYEKVDVLIELGMVEPGGYSHYKLTDLGKRYEKEINP